jgi:SAM-dependent methyltransferase
MKRRLLDLIQCPMCGGTLACEAFVETAEVDEGKLTCGGCARDYPIIGTIPRLLPDALSYMTPRYHAEFFERYGDQLRAFLGRCTPPADDSWWKLEQRTLRSYSYQWRKFKAMLPHWEQVFQESVDPITPEFFRGKRGLDAGCGFGRSLHYSATYGAEMIGMDLSEAIEAARENTRQFPNVHLVQADIFHPPVADRSLDFVYSIGVVHVLPDPRAGFLRLRRLIKPGAPIFIWLYSRGKGRQIAFVEAMRVISTRLAFRPLNALCWLGAAIQWAVWIWPFKLLNAIGLKGLAGKIPFTYHARYPFYALHTDWFDGLSTPQQQYYRSETVEEWFRAAKLERIQMEATWGQFGGGGRGVGWAPQEQPAQEPAMAASAGR